MAEHSGMTALRYVALGDSYTIGTSVGEEDRWPNQLVRRLAASATAASATAASAIAASAGPDGRGAEGAGPPLDLVANLGRNGYTSGDVIDDELTQLDRLRPEFASLLIGVNDVVQRVPPDAYSRNAAQILDALLARLPADRIVTVATPDYTVTPSGPAFGDPRRKSAAIVAGNATLRALAEARGIAFVDIFEASLRAANDRLMVADDGLHPSGAQYALWVDRIEPVVRALLGPA